MKVLVTMQDDSESLAHHGVQGMKWGVHNEETKRKYGEISGEGGGGGGIVDPDKLKFNDKHQPKNSEELAEALKEVGYSEKDIENMRSSMNRWDAWFDAIDKLNVKKASKKSSSKGTDAITTLQKQHNQAEIDRIKATNPASRTLEEQKKLDESLGHSAIDDVISEAFLAHHGVEGMKWGVHNEETKRKYGEISGEGGGGGGIDEDEDTANKVEGEQTSNETTFGAFVDKQVEWGFKKGSSALRDVVNSHLVDIQTGNINRAEAQILGVVNAAAGLVSGSGKGLIDNPKAEEMGVKYGQRADKIRLI